MKSRSDTEDFGVVRLSRSYGAVGYMELCCIDIARWKITGEQTVRQLPRAAAFLEFRHEPFEGLRRFLNSVRITEARLATDPA